MTDQRIHELDSQLDALNLDAGALAGLFAASDALASQYRLRVTLADTSVPVPVRQQVARQLFAGRIGAPASEAVALAAAASTGSLDLERLVERAAVRGTMTSSGALGRVQDELFRLARTIEGDSELQTTLGDPNLALAARQDLVGDLLAGRAHPVTVQLARRAVAARGKTVVRTLDGYVTVAAEVNDRQVARVVVARPLGDAQLATLRAELTRIYGVGIDVAVELDPEVLGGIRIEIGDELIDGTIRSRVSQARRLIG